MREADTHGDRVAIVTGGGRGIGAATAARLAAAGMRVVVASRSIDELDTTARAIAARVGADRVFTVPTDIGSEADVVALFEKTINRFGDLHVLVNNAARFIGREVVNLSVGDWDSIQVVNVRGAFLAARETFRRLRGLDHGGAIVNIASLGGLRGTEKFPGFAAYTVSKFAVVGLTEALAVEGRPLGIRVNCVAPGAVATRMLREAAPFLGTTTTADDVAQTVHFLCDDEQSRAVTGAVIEIHSNGPA